MPLTGTDAVLSAALKAEMLSSTSALPFKCVDGPELTAFCNTLASVLIAHILANAIVVTVGSATTQTGPVT